MEEREYATALEEIEEQPPRRRFGGKMLALTIGLGAVGLLAAAYLALCAVAATDETVRGGTSVLGVDVSGCTREQVEALWRSRSDEVCRETAINVTSGGEKVGSVSLADLAVTVTPEAAADAAWRVGRGSGFLDGGWAWLKSRMYASNVMPRLHIEEKKFNAALGNLDKVLDCTVVDGAYRLDESKTDGFYVTKPRDGLKIDLKAVASMLENAVVNGDLRPIECAGERVAAKTLDMDALYEQLQAESANAVYDKESGRVTDEVVGVSFDREEAKELMEQAEAGEEFVVPAKITFPTVSREELENGALFRDCLGSCTTVATGSYNRLRNVALAAKTVNGVILNPGEQFSYNDAVGDTGKELGYYPAPAYVGGKSVDVYGGGVCQVSSTMYYAALLSNLKIVERACHQFTPAYIMWGADATTYYPWVDFVYENDTDYPIKMVAVYDNNTDKITVSIYGTKVDDTYVKITNSVLSSTPSHTEYVEDETLAPGKEEVEQYGYTGYYVRTWRNVYAADGTLLSSEVEANSDYEMRPTIIRVGPEKEPEPEPPATPGEEGGEEGGGTGEE